MVFIPSRRPSCSIHSLNVEGISKITYTDASPSAVKMFPKFSEVFGAVADNRRISPECGAMRGGR